MLLTVNLVLSTHLEKFLPVPVYGAIMYTCAFYSEGPVHTR